MRDTVIAPSGMRHSGDVLVPVAPTGLVGHRYNVAQGEYSMMFRLKQVVAVVLLLTLAVSAGADLVPMVPQDAALVIGINFAKIVTVPDIQKKIEEGLAKNPVNLKIDKEKKEMSYPELVAKIGFDPIKDIKEVIVYLPPVLDQKVKPEPAVIMAGAFEEAKITEKFSTDADLKGKMKAEKFEGLNAFRDSENKGLQVFLDAHTIAFGGEDAVRRVVALKNGKDKNLLANADFANLLKLTKTDSMVWGAGKLSTEQRAMIAEKASGTPAMPFANLTSLLFSVDFAGDLDLSITANADKKENGEMITGVLNGFLMMGKSMNPPPEALEVLNMITIKGEGPASMLNLKLPKAKIEALMEKSKKMMEGGLMPPAMPDQDVKPEVDKPAPAKDEKKDAPAAPKEGETEDEE